MNNVKKNPQISQTAILGAGCLIFGKSRIGNDCILEWNVIVGSPSRGTIIKNRNLTASNGSIVGSDAVIHSGTVIYENVHIGRTFRCGHNTIIRENVFIGNNSSVGSNVTIEPNVFIGNNVRMQGGITVAPRTKIANNVFIGPNVVITDGRLMTAGQIAAGRMTKSEALRQEKKVLHRLQQIIGDDVRIGANAVILAGVKLGKGSIISASALVSEDVPPRAIIAGNPGRIIKLKRR